jgi:hypothetical protein
MSQTIRNGIESGWFPLTPRKQRIIEYKRVMLKEEMGKQRKPYIILSTNDTSDAKRKTPTLNKSEWTNIERLFRKHPELASIECVDRTYPPEIRLK